MLTKHCNSSIKKHAHTKTTTKKEKTKKQKNKAKTKTKTKQKRKGIQNGFIELKFWSGYSC
jgi:hypothetical protein